MKRTQILMMAVAAAVVAAPCVQAKNVVLKVNVPFDFVVADQQLPSGEYQIEQEPDARWVRISSTSGDERVLAQWVPAVAATEDGGKLVFHKYGGQRFLKMIRGADGSGAYLPETRTERDARMAGSEGTAAVGMP
jgi:hypothetical protein